MSTDISRLLKTGLDPAAWKLIQSIQTINAAQLNYPIYLVGGAVRDILLGSQSADLDFVTEGDGVELARAVSSKLGGDIIVHERFKTANWSPPMDVFTTPIDFVTARRERYETPAALPIIEPSNLQDDLYRRDFSINAMAVQIDTEQFGRLHDLFNGQEDLKKEIVEVLHSLSFQDDPTRIWRAVRYESRFKISLGQNTKAWLTRDLSYHQLLSPDRIRHEWEKVMGEKSPLLMIDRLAELNVLQTVHPLLHWKPVREKAHAWFQAFEQQTTGLTLGDQSRHRFLLLMLSFDLYGQDLAAVAEALNFDRQFVNGWIWLHNAMLFFEKMVIEKTVTPIEVVEQLKNAESEVWYYLLKSTWSRDDRESAYKNELLTRYLNEWRYVSPISDGNTLKSLGLKPGPIFKTILTQLLEEKLNGKLVTEEDEINFIRGLIQ